MITAFNITENKIDTFNIQKQKPQGYFHYYHKEGYEKRKKYNPSLYIYPYRRKSGFGEIYALPFDTFSVQNRVNKVNPIIIKDDGIYLYPNSTWKSFLQEYKYSAYLNVEYLHDKEWISPYRVTTFAACLKPGALSFLEFSKNTGIKIYKPKLYHGDTIMETRFSLEVINHENDTTKIYSQPFTSKVYSGYLEHPRPFELNGMIRF